MIASSIVFQVPSKIIVVETVCSQVHQHSRYIAMFTPTAESNVWLLFVAEQEDNKHKKKQRYGTKRVSQCAFKPKRAEGS